MGVGITIGSSSPSGSSPPVPLLVALAAVVLELLVVALLVVLAAVVLELLVVALLVVLAAVLPPPAPPVLLVLPPVAAALLLELLPPWPSSSGVAASSEQPIWMAPTAPITSSKVKADFISNLMSLPLVLESGWATRGPEMVAAEPGRRCSSATR
ncbi:hypothetical protein WME97_18825 [Sorangium sp. So ce367]|uniref:hypothetical protein n=1 Tax=Sorangium sp. So ce367 TaxID=3133305 RepID=UPI003F602F4E